MKRPLFWKIFLIVWLSNLGIMFATLQIVISLHEQQTSLERIHTQAQILARAIIKTPARYREFFEYNEAELIDAGLENIEPIDDINQWQYSINEPEDNTPKSPSIAPPLIEELFAASEDFELNIYNAHGDLIFPFFISQEALGENDYLPLADNSAEYDNARTTEGDVVNFTLTIENEAYHIEVIPYEEPFFFLYDITQQIQNISFLIILLVSTVVSLLISFLINRPIASLRQQANAISQGELDSRLSPQLLTRHDEIGDLARDFHTMTEAIAESINRQQYLLHNISHELRAPLARLQAAAAIALQQPDKHQQSFTRVDQECERINELLSEILYLVTPEHKLSKAPFDLIPLLHSLADDMHFQFPEQRIEIQSHGLQHAQITGSELWLRQAFENILGNACKYHLSTSSITLSIEQQKDHYQLEIRDQGEGVTDEELGRLLEPFFRGEGHRHQGLGLGLSIANHIIKQQHGGQISLQHNQPQGLVVTIQLAYHSA